jgi:uncharacterized protein (TIGR03067 family)
MNFVTAWMIAGSIAVAGGELELAIKKDKAALQGTWKVTASVSKGEKSSADDIKNLFLIFKGDAILVREGGKTEEKFSYSLDPLKTTKELDLTLKVGPQKGRVDRAIYKIEGDKLTICIQTNKDAPRPREFRSPVGSELWLVTLERTKE